MYDALNTDAARRALAAHDIATVYRLLRAAGVSQRQIAALTGQSQSEISEILSGRQVQGYDLLLRICEGLDVPRDWMGLAYSDDAAYAGSDDDPEELDDDVLRRRFLGLGSLTVLGKAILGEPGTIPSPGNVPTPLPEHVGLADVDQFIAGTARLRALDRQYGGAGVYRAVAGFARRGERLLPLASSDAAYKKLAAAIADCHVLAGWASFDAGHPEKGRHHFHRALTFCETADNAETTAAVLYTIARMEIDSDAPNEGLKHLQLAQVGLASVEPAPVVARFVQADIGRAYAAMGHENEARDAILRTTYELPGEHNAADLMGVTSATRASLSDYDEAALILHKLLPQRRDTAARGAAGELIRLSTVCIEMGEISKGLAVGRQALIAVNAVPGSARTLQRLVPLRDAAGRRKDSACQDFAQMVQRRLSA